MYNVQVREVERHSHDSRENHDSFLEVLFFTSPLCGPCPKIEERLLEAIDRKMLPIKVNKIDVLETPDIAESYDIIACPTIIFPNFLRVCGSYDSEIIEELVTTYFASTFEIPTVEEFSMAHK
jgi:thiol-disulfide isomerase/thioredoxin